MKGKGTEAQRRRGRRQKTEGRRHFLRFAQAKPFISDHAKGRGLKN